MNPYLKSQQNLERHFAQFLRKVTPTAPEPVLYSYDTVCPLCGATSEHFARQPMERAEYVVYCARCTEA